jgi:predicted ribosomally synthesized peptide with SipW-like signal peptide
MLRGTLLSLLTIGAVAFIVGGATFAPFSDSGDATGSVSAGTLQININGDPGAPEPVTFMFNTEAYCPGNMAVGDSCTAVLTITNVGTLAGEILSINAWIQSVDPVNGCTGEPEEPVGEVEYNWNVALTGPVDGEDELNELADLLLPPDVEADSALLTVTVALNETDIEGADINDCQDSTAVVIVRVVVEQAAEPHTESDTGT